MPLDIENAKEALRDYVRIKKERDLIDLEEKRETERRQARRAELDHQRNVVVRDLREILNQNGFKPFRFHLVGWNEDWEVSLDHHQSTQVRCCAPLVKET